ncbi:MAG: hypothetical protein GX160_06775 [Clostridiales bacterium]|nr:hypothetical protein [Clostridiales bacterium]
MNTLLRLLSYILTRLTLLAVIAILIILAIFIGFDWANINVIINEALTKRTEVILTNQEPTELNKFFTQEYLDRDPLLSRNPYESYDITKYDHRIKVKKLWVWPWQDKTKVVVEEIVTGIEGSNKNEDSEETIIPAWESGEKIVVMEKDGRWRIENVILSKPIEPEIENQTQQQGDVQEDQNEESLEEQQEEGQEE